MINKNQKACTFQLSVFFEWFCLIRDIPLIISVLNLFFAEATVYVVNRNIQTVRVDNKGVSVCVGGGGGVRFYHQIPQV